jgi:type II secretory pathway component PulF
LRDGYSITAAAQDVKGILRYDAVGVLCLGGGAEGLHTLLRHTSAEQNDGQTGLQSVFRLYWFCWYIPFLTLLPVFYMAAIMPKMEAIYQDFGIDLPGTTKLAIQISNGFIAYSYLIVPYLLLFVIALILYLTARSRLIPWRPFGLRRLMRQTDAVRFLRIFAAGWKQHKTVSETVGAYKQVVPGHYLKALRKINFLASSEAALLDAAVRVQNVPAMLNEIAAAKEQQQIREDNTQGQIVFFSVILLIGIFVGFQAVAFFLPIVKLIDVMSMSY